MWIKICGNTNLEDALFAARAGASALGFVFAPSPRRVTANQVREIVGQLPPHIETYGVFVDAGFDEIVATVVQAGLTGVQIHRTTDQQLPARLRQHFGPQNLNIMLALNYKAGSDAFEQQLSDSLAGDPAQEAHQVLDAVLVDSSTARAVGGTGTRFDWEAAQASFRRFAPRMRLIAAGGLTPGNVQQAIQMLNPAGVDVVTGVEATPGRKDFGRIQDFIQAARNATIEVILKEQK